MSELVLTFIGTANAFTPTGNCWNGFVANGRHLFEAPPSALMGLRKLGFDPNDIETVILSHHHGDHFLGLPFLLLHWKYFGKRTPVTIIGPPGTEQYATEITERVYPGLFEPPLSVVWAEVAPGERTEVTGLGVQAIEVEHDRRLSACLGFLVDLDGHRLGYTGDSRLCDAILGLAQESDVLVSECTFRDGSSPSHMNLRDDMPRVRSAMRPGAPLILTHLEGPMDSAGLPATTVAQDFATYRL